VWEIFSYSFMQRAFIVGNVIGIAAPLIGVFLNLKRLSLLGHALSHIALAGVAIGIFLGMNPVILALMVSTGAGVTIEKLRQTGYKNYAELPLAIILATGLGVATIFISLADSNVAIYSYLFGSISLVTQEDLWIIVPLGAVVLGGILTFYYGFFFLAFNEEEASLAGVPVKILNYLFMIMIAIVISLSMRIIGGLLIASLIILPVAASLQIAGSFRGTVIWSTIFGLIAVNLGLIISFYRDLAPGGTIIIVAVTLLIFSLLWKSFGQKGGRKNE